MLIYCAHEFGGDPKNILKAGEIIRALQIGDLENTYISPIHSFIHLGYNSIGYKDEIRLCLNLLARCDKLLILSEISEGIRYELMLARKLNIPIEFWSDEK